MTAEMREDLLIILHPFIKHADIGHCRLAF